MGNLCLVMFHDVLFRGRMVDKHSLKSSSGVWSRDLLLFFIVFIAEKPASRKYDAEKGGSASVTLFVMMGYSCWRDNKNEAISANECFSFNLLSCLISMSSSSATVNSADSNALNANGFLTQSKENTSRDGNNFQCFYLAMTNFVESNRQDFCPVCNVLPAQTFQLCSLFFLFWLPTVLAFP
jgi:hypothetical protein